MQGWSVEPVPRGLATRQDSVTVINLRTRIYIPAFFQCRLFEVDFDLELRRVRKSQVIRLEEPREVRNSEARGQKTRPGIKSAVLSQIPTRLTKEYLESNRREKQKQHMSARITLKSFRCHTRRSNSHSLTV